MTVSKEFLLIISSASIGLAIGFIVGLLTISL